MDKINKNGKSAKKIIRFKAGSASQHFRPSNNFPNDILGSYTGTPRNGDITEDYPDLYPVQDADDL